MLASRYAILAAANADNFSGEALFSPGQRALRLPAW
jgi:hypothetical protein